MELFPDKFTVKTARAIQAYVAAHVSAKKDFREISCITGVDVSYSDDIASVAFVTLRFPDFAETDRLCAITRADVPYRPGFFAFREGPPIVRAYGNLKQKPELLLFDGHGVAHPAGAGLASHLGLFLDTPSIGCAKSMLCGEYEPPPAIRGSFSKIRQDNETIGVALRTKDNHKPVFVSVGHRIDLATAVEFVLFSCRDHRVPEPIRLAHRLSGQCLKDYLATMDGS
jgi:deoxyribonuclease V